MAVYLGSVLTSPGGVPALVLEPHLVPARQELFGFRAWPRHSRGRYVLVERARACLEQTAMGLEHLHLKGLVHLELSLDSVMVGIL